MPFAHPRLAREAATVEAMIRLHCKMQKHAVDTARGDGLCVSCGSLLDYANLRLEKCPFQEGKTTCAKCPVHCYKPDKRAQVREVMRSAGPHMLYRHPLLTVYHLLDGRRKKPLTQKKVHARAAAKDK